MSVRAKMTCEAAGDGKVVLRPVVGGSEENDRFYEATPGGQLVLETVNPAAVAQFDVGKEYFVDITPA